MQFKITFDANIKTIFSEHDRQSFETISMYPASSEDNDFIPYHALQSGRLITVGERKTLLYSLEVHTEADKCKNHEDFFEAMIRRSDWHRLFKKNIIQDYRVRRGQLVHIKPNGEVDLLASLVVSKNHLFNINKANPDYSKFYVVIDKKFNTELHANLYKSFTKYYLAAAIKCVDIIFTKSLKSLCYNHAPLQPMKPKTISEAKMINSILTEKAVISILNREIF